MNIERLFKVLVVTGASAAGVAGCGGSGTNMPTGTGGHSSSNGSGGESAAAGSGGAAGGAASCDAVCKPSKIVSSWIDCNGCCCWLPAGMTCASDDKICGDEPCCVGRGR